MMLFTIFALVFGPFSLAASANSYDVDPGSSIVGFQIAHVGNIVEGRFHKFSGVFRFDNEVPRNCSVSFRVLASSIDTEHAERDEYLRGPVFFDAETYPVLEFQSTEFRALAQDTFQLDGELEIHGVRQKESFLVTILKPTKPDRLRFHASTVLNRRDYDIVWNAILDRGMYFLSDEVHLSLEIEGISRAAPFAVKVDTN